MSNKPCPGCGEVKKWRKATDICEECRLLMHDGRLFRAINLKESSGEIIGIPKASHWLPHTDGDFQKAFLNLVKVICDKTDATFYGRAETPYSGKPEGSSCDFYGAKKGTAEALRELWSVAVKAFESYRSKGHRDGRNLLSGLASGEISASDYDIRAKREERRL